MKLLIHLLIILVLTINCQKEQISVSGSETMHEMILQVSHEFTKANPSFTVDVRGGGSLEGLEKLIAKQSNIALSSIEPNAPEVLALAKNQRLDNVVLAYDGAAIVVNPENPLVGLNLEVISKIFSGEIKNWKEIGGKDQPILLVIRNDKSGTASYIKEHILRKKDLGPNYYSPLSEYSSEARVVKDNNELIDVVSKEKGSVSYIGMGFISLAQGKVKALKFSRKEKDELVEPNIENIMNRKYRLSRGLYLLYPEKPEKKIDAYISFVTSEVGQKVVNQTGYLRSSLPEIVVEEKKK